MFVGEFPWMPSQVGTTAWKVREDLGMSCRFDKKWLMKVNIGLMGGNLSLKYRKHLFKHWTWNAKQILSGVRHDTLKLEERLSQLSRLSEERLNAPRDSRHGDNILAKQSFFLNQEWNLIFAFFPLAVQNQYDLDVRPWRLSKAAMGKCHYQTARSLIRANIPAKIQTERHEKF